MAAQLSQQVTSVCSHSSNRTANTRDVPERASNALQLISKPWLRVVTFSLKCTSECWVYLCANCRTSSRGTSTSTHENIFWRAIPQPLGYLQCRTVNCNSLMQTNHSSSRASVTCKEHKYKQLIPRATVALPNLTVLQYQTKCSACTVQWNDALKIKFKELYSRRNERKCLTVSVVVHSKGSQSGSKRNWCTIINVDDMRIMWKCSN
jgi:hypothetical protein